MPTEDKQKILKFLKLISLERGLYSKDSLVNIFVTKGSLESALRKFRKICLENEKLPFISLKSNKYFYLNQSVLEDYMSLIMSGQIKEIESLRYAKIIDLIEKNSLSITEISDKLNESLGYESEKYLEPRTTRNYLNVLLRDGFIEQTKSKKNKLYTLKVSLNSLSKKTLTKLYLFIEFYTNAGMLITRSLILKNLLAKELNFEEEIIRYNHPKYIRVFDELIVMELLNLLQNDKMSKIEVKLLSKNKNPEIKKIILTPRYLVFDYHLARWYLITSGITKKILVDRIIDFKKISKNYQEIDDDFKNRLDNIKKTWLIEEDAEEKKIIIKFYFDSSSKSKNFILKRVKREAIIGKIIACEDENFILEILTRETNEIKPWIRSFGSSAEVLEPLSLRNELINDYNTLKTSYQKVINEV